jgi:hypothetical protein
VNQDERDKVQTKTIELNLSKSIRKIKVRALKSKKLFNKHIIIVENDSVKIIELSEREN